jgi:hypothetical protein
MQRSNPSEVVLGKRKFHAASFNRESVPIHLTDDQPTDTSDSEEDLDNFDEGIDGSSSDSDNDAGEPSLFEDNSLGAFDYFLTVSLVIFSQIVMCKIILTWVYLSTNVKNVEHKCGTKRDVTNQGIASILPSKCVVQKVKF